VRSVFFYSIFNTANPHKNMNGRGRGIGNRFLLSAMILKVCLISVKLGVSDDVLIDLLVSYDAAPEVALQFNITVFSTVFKHTI